METAARESGLCQLSQCDAAVRHATDLLGRLSKHPLRSEIETAADRYHELPYCRKVDNYAEIGFIDLLFRASSGWQIIDFKTDSIRSIAEREHLSNLYTRQMCRYSNAIEALIGQKPITRICFLDSLGKIELVNQN